MHDWTRVDAGIYHAFHHEWISEISRCLNRELLPGDYYALPEQIAAGFGPDVLTLQDQRAHGTEAQGVLTVPALKTRPKTRFVFETESEFYRRKKSSVAVRHVSGDRIVAMIEIVSPGNKSTKRAIAAFVNKASELLEQRIHLLIIDPFPPSVRDPHGMHAALWAEVEDDSYSPSEAKPLAASAYECDLITRAFVEPFAVGDVLPDMPLFLEPDGCVQVPLEATYQTAFEAMPRRWREVLDG